MTAFTDKDLYGTAQPPSLRYASVQNNLCLFAHYDAHGRVADYVLHYLKEIQACQFDIVFVSTAKLDDQELRKVSPFTIDIIVRANIGHDFGSWIEAYSKHKGNPAGLLLLCNDSVYGPLWDLATTVRKLLTVESDFYGMVRSNEIDPHIQSWFVLLTPRAHQSEAFKNLMNAEAGGLTKQEIIRKFEVGLTTSLEAAGLRSRALYDPRSHRLRPRMRFNPSHFLWRQLIKTYGVPFIKIELLRDNPARVHLRPWPKVVGAHSQDVMRQMTRHLSTRQRQSGLRTIRISRIHQALFLSDDIVSRRGWSGVQSLNFRSWKAACWLIGKLGWLKAVSRWSARQWRFQTGAPKRHTRINHRTRRQVR